MQLVSRLKFIFDNFRYQRRKYFYICIFLLALSISAFSISSFLHQKNEITKNRNILESYFDEIKEKESPAGGPEVSGDGAVKPAKITVYICGYVNNPGVYELDENSRVEDLLKICGGLSIEASKESLNLAKKLNDSEKVYVPSQEEANKIGPDIDLQPYGAVNTVDINHASEEGLALLPGIGPAIASDIIDYRDSHGFFQSIEDLKNVKGIGEKKFEKIKDLISV